MAQSTNPHYRHTEPELDSGFEGLLAEGPLDPGTRGLALAAAAAAAGRRDVMRAVLKLLLRRGLDPVRLRETLLQTYLFAGYPRAINALAELTALLPDPPQPPVVDLGMDQGEDRVWLARGQALCRRVYGSAYDRLLMTMARISPELGRWMVVEGYGKVLSRPALGAKERELTAVAALMTLEVPDQLRAHLRGAFLVGAERAEVEGVLATAALVTPDLLDDARALLDQVAARLS